jgi:serine/threonine protein kinase
VVEQKPPSLSAEQTTRLERGEHEAVAKELDEAGALEAAAWVLQQIWDFRGASERYLRANLYRAALHAALESSDASVTEACLSTIEREADGAEIRDAIVLLEARGRHAEAARLLQRDSNSAQARARALARAGNLLGAAQVFLEAGQLREALEVLGPLDERPARAAALALAARICWELGDAEATARLAQAGLRVGADEPALPALLARALGTLGHDLAAQIVLQGRSGDVEIPPVRGRYHVTGVLPANIAGAAYVGLDRVTLQEVEIHLLLAEFVDGDAPGPAVREAIERFARVAEAASALAHPAIRSVERIDVQDGLVVLPRTEGPILRSLIRAPGMLDALPRARAMIAFLLEGLAAAHASGLVHGTLLPSQIFCDALGRPLLGPFGVHHLSGLVATRTGGLEEVLSMTAPELRASAPPSPASDMFSVGALYSALLLGSVGGDPEHLPAEEREMIAAMTSAVPEQRPSALAAFQRVHVPVADVSRVAVGREIDPGESQTGRTAHEVGVGEAVLVTAATSWADGDLDALCRARDPRLQTILDRDGRTFWLASWPEGCRRLGPDFDWRDFIGEVAFESLEPEIKSALHGRMVSDAAIKTPAGEWMVALDRLLAL